MLFHRALVYLLFWGSLRWSSYSYYIGDLRRDSNRGRASTSCLVALIRSLVALLLSLFIVTTPIALSSSAALAFPLLSPSSSWLLSHPRPSQWRFLTSQAPTRAIDSITLRFYDAFPSLSRLPPSRVPFLCRAQQASLSLTRQEYSQTYIRTPPHWRIIWADG
jgi:hypothetical protein